MTHDRFGHSRIKNNHYRLKYSELPEPVVFMSVAMSTSVRINEEFCGCCSSMPIVVVDVSDIGYFVISYHKGPSGRGEITGHPALASVALGIVVPEDLTWVNGFVEVGDQVLLSWTENNGRVDVARLLHSLRREYRIPCGTKVLYVVYDDLHVFRIKH